MGCNILLISDDDVKTHQLISKLIFLRENDKIFSCTYNDAKSFVSLKNAEVVLIHENACKETTLKLIKELRKNKNLCIILLPDSNDSQIILSAYDCGIDDFILTTAEDFEFVVRIVNNIKHNSIKLFAQNNNEILRQLYVIDDSTGFYGCKYLKQIINSLPLKDYVFMALTPSNAYKLLFLIENFSNAVKNSLRVEDIVVMSKENIFYIFLSKTDINGAIVVLNKIKENYVGDIELCAGISDIKENNFVQVEKQTLNVLANALATDAEYIVVSDKEDSSDEWLDDNLEDKKYKIFMQIYNKKVKNVIAPVFADMQEIWQEKLYNTQVTQNVTDEECIFVLKNDKLESILKITYPGFAKVVVSITHSGLDSPENSEQNLSLSMISKSELVKIIEDFVKDFKSVI